MTQLEAGGTAVVTAEVALPSRRMLGVSDLSVFPLAIGGNVFGWTADDDATNGVLDAYRAAGGNLIDTADSYAGGRSETMIGNWMRSRRSRGDMVIATKVGKSADHPGLTPTAVMDAVDDSLRRLDVGTIDLLFLHIDDASVPFEETLLAVDSLIRAGKVRWFGGSDHTGNRLIEARVACGQLGVAPMVALQQHYNLLHRTDYEGALARVAAAQSLGVLARFALAGGVLAGSDRSRQVGRKNLRVLTVLDEIASELGSTPASIAIAWLLTRQGVVAPVVSARHAGQVDDLVRGTHLRLTRHHLAELDRISSSRVSARGFPGSSATRGVSAAEWY